jgi:uncharacterized protein (TIGR00730 family)
VKRSGRPYTLNDPQLNESLDALLDQATTLYGRDQGRSYVREMMVSALRLLRDGASRGNLRLVNHALKELRHAFRVFEPYRAVRKVAVFGSARTDPESAEWKQAWDFANRMERCGWMAITGAGGGIMEAAQGGAGRESSFGVNIRLPFEQEANATIRGDEKLINFRYFFTRKVTFVKEAHAIVLLPGGFGTLDEGFETLTLIQTGKSEILPVVFLDAPGGSYWREWLEFMQRQLLGNGLISDFDMSLFKVCDDFEDAVVEILRFYSNYHSSRYVRDRLVLRVRVAPDAEQRAAIEQDFEDLLHGEEIEVSGPLAAEGDEAPGYERVILRFDRKRVGRLRELIDRLNSLVADEEVVRGDAAPHEIFELDFSPETLQRQEEEEA